MDSAADYVGVWHTIRGGWRSCGVCHGGLRSTGINSSQNLSVKGVAILNTRIIPLPEVPHPSPPPARHRGGRLRNRGPKPCPGGFGQEVANVRAVAAVLSAVACRAARLLSRRNGDAKARSRWRHEGVPVAAWYRLLGRSNRPLPGSAGAVVPIVRIVPDGAGESAWRSQRRGRRVAKVGNGRRIVARAGQRNRSHHVRRGGDVVSCAAQHVRRAIPGALSLRPRRAFL